MHGASNTVGRGLERITIEPGKMGGQPCIRRTRMPVATIVAMVAEGRRRRFSGDFPDLERDDIHRDSQVARVRVV